MNDTLRNIFTSGFWGLGASAGEPAAVAVKNTVKVVGFVALVFAGVWIYSKVKS